MSRMLTINLDEVLGKNQAEQRRLRDQADELVAKVTTESRDFTKEEEQKLTELQNGIVTIGKRNDLLRKQAELGGTLDAPGEPRTRPNFKPGEKTGQPEEREARDKKHRTAYDKWIRRGMGVLNEEERDLMQNSYTELDGANPEVRAMSALTGVTGGFTVPVGFMGRMEEAMKDFSGVLKSRATQLTTDTGVDIPYPTVNDTSNEGEQVEENAATTDGPEPAFGQLSLKAYLYSSRLVLLPIALIQDTGVDVESLLGRLLAERLGRITNKRWTTGNNANQPQGIVTGSTLGKQVAGATAVTYDELVDLQVSIDPAYDGNAEWMFHKSTFGALRKLKDSDGRPIWMPAMNSGMAGGAPGLLLDKPYVVNQNMAAMASGARSILYGDMSKYMIRRVKNMVLVRLAERYAEKFQVGFFAFMRCDGRVIDAGTNPIKHILHP